MRAETATIHQVPTGTRSLKTEQDEEADQPASPLWRHDDRRTPVRLARLRVCLVQMIYPVSDPALLKPAALGPTDRGSQTTEALVLRLLSFRALSKLVSRLRTLAPSFHGEFDPGSGRTLAACLTHASRTRKHLRV